MRFISTKKTSLETSFGFKKKLIDNGFQPMSLPNFPYMIEHYPTQDKIGEKVILFILNELREDDEGRASTIDFSQCTIVTPSDKYNIGAAEEVENSLITLFLT
jgi:hypothetical protein